MKSPWLYAIVVASSTLGCSATNDAEDPGAGGSTQANAGSGNKAGTGGKSTGGNGSGGATAGGGSSTGGSGNAGGCSASSAGSGGGDPPTGSPEQCGNGLDDDLNGFIDEGCSCALGAMQPCFDGPPSKAGIGACLKGTQTCSGSEFGQWGPCIGSGSASSEVCDGSVDDDCDGVVDQTCGTCCEGETKPCGVGSCAQATQTCSGGKWSECSAGGAEICNNQIDDDCDGQVDEGCTLDVVVNIDGDCVTAACPPQAPHAVGCSIYMAGNDQRGCIANNGGPIVYFQEGDDCGAGHVNGTLTCSSQPGAPLSPLNCAINKSSRFYPMDPSGCPDT